MPSCCLRCGRTLSRADVCHACQGSITNQPPPPTLDTHDLRAIASASAWLNGAAALLAFHALLAAWPLCGYGMYLLAFNLSIPLIGVMAVLSLPGVLTIAAASMRFGGAVLHDRARGGPAWRAWFGAVAAGFAALTAVGGSSLLLSLLLLAHSIGRRTHPVEVAVVLWAVAVGLVCLIACVVTVSCLCRPNVGRFLAVRSP